MGINTDAIWTRLENGQDTQLDLQDCLLYIRELEQALEAQMVSKLDACSLLKVAKFQIENQERNPNLEARIGDYLREQNEY